MAARTHSSMELTAFIKQGFSPYKQAVSNSNPLLLRLTEWRQHRKTLSWPKGRIFLGIWAFAKELKRKGQEKSMLTFCERAEIFTAFFRWTRRTDRESKQYTYLFSELPRQEKLCFLLYCFSSKAGWGKGERFFTEKRVITVTFIFLGLNFFFFCKVLSANTIFSTKKTNSSNEEPSLQALVWQFSLPREQQSLRPALLCPLLLRAGWVTCSGCFRSCLEAVECCPVEKMLETFGGDQESALLSHSQLPVQSKRYALLKSPFSSVAYVP